MHLRYEGSDTTIAIVLSDFAEMAKHFALKHAQQFGFGFEGRALIAESLEVEAISSPQPRRREGERRRLQMPMRRNARAG